MQTTQKHVLAPLSRSKALCPKVARPPLRISARATAVSTPSKDATSDLLKTALSAALANHLRQHSSIAVDVRSTMAGLAQGIFGGLTIRGERWATPLALTAEKIEVDVGELLLDYGALVFNSSVALRNMPGGTVAITLTAQDLGNFMSHVLLKPIACKAVQGKAFNWDRASVHIGQDSKGRGYVDFEGTWEVDGGRYKVRMVPTAVEAPGKAVAAGARPATRLQVSAKKLVTDSSMEDGNSSAGEQPVQPTAAAAAAATPAPATAAGPTGAAAVAQGLAQMFSSLSLNLQGIELQKPSLAVLLPGTEGGVPLLEIRMKLRIRALPPLNMEF